MPPPMHMGRGYPPPPAPSQSQGYPQSFPPVSHHQGHPHQRPHPGIESSNSAARQSQQHAFNHQKQVPKQVSVLRK